MKNRIRPALVMARAACLALLGSLLLPAQPARSLTLVVNGLDGAYATETQPAEPGDPAEAHIVGASDPVNRAEAEGGLGGGKSYTSYPGNPAPGGNAHASIEASSPSDLAAHAEAEGGRGGLGSDGTGGAGGDAHASAVASNDTAASIDVSAIALGGDGGWADAGGAGGEASLGPVYGRSTGGGDVTVFGSLRHGTVGPTPEDAPGTSGRDVTLWNAVDGDTTGALRITQQARAGNAGGGIGAYRAGNAESRLAKTTASESLSLDGLAVGGSSVHRYSASGRRPGGTATSFVHGHNLTGAVEVSSLAGGGIGNTPGAPGGGRARSEAIGVGHGGGSVAVFGRASGGSATTGLGISASGRGGDARSFSLGIAFDGGDVTVEDEAEGGRSGTFSTADPSERPPQAAGADSTAIAVGNDTVVARAEAIGADGGYGEWAHDGGSASARAIAVSLGGDASAYVIQQGGEGGRGAQPGDGADSHLHNAASGFAAGTLTLEQRAVGGDIGQPDFGSDATVRAGDVSSHLRGTNPGGGDLSLYVRAEGGNGGSHADGGTATVSAIGWSDTGANVNVQADALGGYAFEKTTGRVEFGEVSGRSNGGDVYVRAYGVSRSVNGFGFGRDVEMIDVVSGETTGTIRLFQTAQAGSGLHPGNALSSLTREVDAELIEAVVNASGAHTGVARLDLRNRSGAAVARTSAYGDVAEAEIHVEGNGGTQSALVNSPMATGSTSGTGIGERGGSASIRATGIERGDGLVYLWHIARGGRGSESEVGEHGSGGDAFVSNYGRAEGTGSVVVVASAEGGRSGMANAQEPETWIHGEGGDARAIAEGHGSDYVRVEARSTGGQGLFSRYLWPALDPGTVATLPSLYGRNGTARSRAVGSGTDGFVLAESQVDGGMAGSIMNRALLEVAGGQTFVSESQSAHRGGLAAFSADAQAWSGGSLHPRLAAGELEARGARHFDAGHQDEVIAVASLGSHISGSPEAPVTAYIEYEIDLYSHVESGSETLYLELFGVESAPSAFDSIALRVQSNLAGGEVLDFRTEDPDDAIAELDGLLIDLGAILAPSLYPGRDDAWQYSFAILRIDLEVVVSKSDGGFGFDVAIGHAGAPVPEAPAWLMLAIGLVGLGCVGRRSERSGTPVLP